MPKKSPEFSAFLSWTISILIIFTLLYLYKFSHQTSFTNQPHDMISLASQSETHPTAPTTLTTFNKHQDSIKNQDQKPKPIPQGHPAQNNHQEAQKQSHLFKNQDESLWKRELDKKNNFITKYENGKTLHNLGQKYNILNLRAIPKNEYQGPEDQIVAERLNFVFIPKHEKEEDNPLAFREKEFPVVAKSTNGMLGIITGTVIVSFKEPSSPDALNTMNDFEKKYHLHLKSYDADLKRAYFSTPSHLALLNIISDLQNENDVATASLEIIFSQMKL